jgi:hypothetical protein
VREEKPMSKEKREHQIIGVSLLGALVVTTVFLSLVQGELVSPVGLKGEGLLVVLFLYLLFSVVLRRVLPSK